MAHIAIMITQIYDLGCGMAHIAIMITQIYARGGLWPVLLYP